MVTVFMGSDSDLPKMVPALKILKQFGIPYNVVVASAHRTPQLVETEVNEAIAKGTKVFIAGAGMSAHLAGVIASFTTLPVIAVPISATLAGVDALLSMVNMPPGIPVACVGIDGAKNAGILAAQMISIADGRIGTTLIDFRNTMVDQVISKGNKVQEELKEWESDWK